MGLSFVAHPARLERLRGLQADRVVKALVPGSAAQNMFLRVDCETVVLLELLPCDTFKNSAKAQIPWDFLYIRFPLTECVRYSRIANIK
jgi:hypothetical protein